jgi:excisionase family DNA binding protein
VAFLPFPYYAVSWLIVPRIPTLQPERRGEMATHDEILTIPEVAALLKIAEKTVYVLAQRGDLPGFKVGGQWRFSRGAINKWIDAKSQSAVEASDFKRRTRVRG